MTDSILKYLAIVKETYYRLVLLVGDTTDDYSALIKTLTDKMSIDIHNINLELSERLLHKTARQRKLEVARAMQSIVRDEDTVLLDQIEILFDVNLEQDPLRLLESISRNRTVVAFWNGRIEDEKLIYAEPGHPEYRSYSTNELMIVELNRGEAIV